MSDPAILYEKSFENFIESDDLDRNVRIKRDFESYVNFNLGSLLYNRTGGNPLIFMENDENSPAYDLVLSSLLLQMAMEYNLTTTPEFQVGSALDLIVIERDGNMVDIFYGYVPLIEPKLKNLNVLEISLTG